VLVEEEHKREMGEGFLRLRERHFPGGRISFPGDERGIVQQRAFLEELKELDLSFHALLVDKR
jgi:hypothetical protein